MQLLCYVIIYVSVLGKFTRNHQQLASPGSYYYWQLTNAAVGLADSPSRLPQGHLTDP